MHRNNPPMIKEQGFTLVGVLLVLVVLSLLGMSIITVASNSLKVSTGREMISPCFTLLKLEQL